MDMSVASIASSSFLVILRMRPVVRSTGRVVRCGLPVPLSWAAGTSLPAQHAASPAPRSRRRRRGEQPEP
jgi:hypothetical protein